MNLSDVSRTAILTLLAHVAASENEKVDFNDPMAVLCQERLLSIACTQEKKWIIRQKRMINTHDARAMARRVADQAWAVMPACLHPVISGVPRTLWGTCAGFTSTPLTTDQRSKKTSPRLFIFGD